MKIIQAMKRSCMAIVLMCVVTAGMAKTARAAEESGFAPVQELKQASGRLWGETKEMVTTPFTLDSSTMLQTAGVLGAVGLTYAFDGTIRDKVQKNKSRSLDKAADAVSLAGDPYLHLGMAALLYGGGVMADSPRWKETGEMLGEALILADASTLILKEATGRGRPGRTAHKGDFHPAAFRTDYDSLPSMHTASSFAMASVLARTSDSAFVSVISYSAATLVGLSRLKLNKHWASDVLLGAALGELAGRVTTSYHVGKRNYALVPSVTEGGGGLAVAGRF